MNNTVLNDGTVLPEGSEIEEGDYIEIDSSELGKFKLLLPVPSSPVLWHGNFGTSKVTIYEGIMLGKLLRPFRTLIYVFTDTAYPENEGVGYQHFSEDLTVQQEVEYLVDHFKAHYALAAQEHKDATLANGSASLH